MNTAGSMDPGSKHGERSHEQQLDQQDAASVFSRTAGANGTAIPTTAVLRPEGDEPYQRYESKMAAAPSPRREYTYRVNQDCELRSVASVVSECNSA